MSRTSIALGLLIICMATLPLEAAPRLPSDPSYRIPVVDEDGNHQFIVYLAEDSAASENAEGEPPARPTSDPNNWKDHKGWHRPSVRAMVTRLEAKYRIESVSMTSYAMPTFAAFIPDSVVRQMRRDPDIVDVQESFMSDDYATWTDRMDGAETVPWGKIAIGTDDAGSSSNVIYVIDVARDRNLWILKKVLKAAQSFHGDILSPSSFLDWLRAPTRSTFPDSGHDAKQQGFPFLIAFPLVYHGCLPNHDFPNHSKGARNG